MAIPRSIICFTAVFAVTGFRLHKNNAEEVVKSSRNQDEAETDANADGNGVWDGGRGQVYQQYRNRRPHRRPRWNNEYDDERYQQHQRHHGRRRHRNYDDEGGHRREGRRRPREPAIHAIILGEGQKYKPNCSEVTIVASNGGKGGSKFLSTEERGGMFNSNPETVTLFHKDEGYSSMRQRWKLEQDEGDYYVIKSLGNNIGKNKVLSAYEKGQGVNMWEGDDESGRQNWLFREAGNGTVTIEVNPKKIDKKTSGYRFLTTSITKDKEVYREKKPQTDGRSTWKLECISR